MNIYEILTFTYGNSATHIVVGYDCVQAVQNSGINVLEIVDIKLVGSMEKVDHIGVG